MALLRSEEGRRSAIVGLWQEIRERSVVFRSFDVSFVNREGNEVAHLCVSKAIELAPVLFWLNCFPNWLMKAARSDCNFTLNQ
jgi:predicted transcriptional regulator YheO